MEKIILGIAGEIHIKRERWHIGKSWRFFVYNQSGNWVYFVVPDAGLWICALRNGFGQIQQHRAVANISKGNEDNIIIIDASDVMYPNTGVQAVFDDSQVSEIIEFLDISS